MKISSERTHDILIKATVCSEWDSCNVALVQGVTQKTLERWEGYGKVEQEVTEILDRFKIPNNHLRKNLIKMAKRLDFEAKGSISWCAEDIIERARDCKKYYLIPNKKQAQEILEELIDNHDCNYGITWEHIDALLTPRKTD